MSTFLSLAAPTTTAGDVLHDTGDPSVSVVTDPRQVMVADSYTAITGQEPTLERLCSGEAAVLALLAPRGAVHDETGLDTCGLIACPDGWTVTATTAPAAVLGPQARQVQALATAMAAAPVEGLPGRLYDTLVQDLRGEPLQGALTALAWVGADVYWWENTVHRAGDAGELVALAARDLIGTVPGWDWEAYATLMAPWMAIHSAGTWPHPHDAVTAAVRQRPHPDPDIVSCRICGCTEDHACPGGCHWIPDPAMAGDLCSRCGTPTTLVRRLEAAR